MLILGGDFVEEIPKGNGLSVLQGNVFDVLKS
jgi:hypothetical protein